MVDGKTTAPNEIREIAVALTIVFQSSAFCAGCMKTAD
jgi:hypothetical protein